MPREYDAAVRRVTQNLSQFPLARLQRPGGYREGQDYVRPLYDDTSFGGAAMRTTLRLHPGVGEQLVALSPLLVPVLQAEWTNQVAVLNALPTEHLRTHLFGRQRQNLGPVRELLRSLQGAR